MASMIYRVHSDIIFCCHKLIQREWIKKWDYNGHNRRVLVSTIDSTHNQKTLHKLVLMSSACSVNTTQNANSSAMKPRARLTTVDQINEACSKDIS